MKKYRVAIIGCGGRAADHIKAYRHINNARVTACCAPSSTRREPLAKKYGLTPYSSAEEMICREKPDMVHIVTWPDVRLEIMALVDRLRVPLCTTEKPLAMGVRDWRELIKIESRSRTKFAVCHQVRWQPLLVKCRRALSNGNLGKVLFIDISAGMNISGQGTHTLNYGMSLNGESPVTRVFGSADGWDESDSGHPAPLATEAYLTFENGVRGLWTSGCVSPRAGAPDIVWQHVRVAAYAEKGRVNYEEFGKWEIVSPELNENGTYGGMAKWAENNLLAQADFHTSMFDWLENKAKVPGTSLKQSLHEWSVVLALYQSRLEGKFVEMKGFNPPDDLLELYKKEVGA